MGANPLSKKIGKCIYCLSTDELSLEHVVPLALNGTLELQDASCENCRKETARFESRLLQDSFRLLRAVLQYTTRSKKKRKAFTHYKAKVKVSGVQEEADIPVEDMIALAPALDMGIPSYLAERFFPNNPYIPVGLKGTYTLKGARSAEAAKAALEKINAESVSLNLKFNVHDFARLLAKIAHGHAVARFGLYNIEKAYLPKLILGDISDPWRYVGRQLGQVLQAKNPQTNPDVIGVSVLDGEILAHIQLFVPLGGPEYLVAVGRATWGLRGILRSVGYTDA
jgi:hypothetical protein